MTTGGRVRREGIINTPKRNHYVPQKYLGAWLVDQRRLFQVDKRIAKPAPKLVSLRDAGVERFFYPPEMEEYFGKQVESPAWPVLCKLRDKAPVSRGELEPMYAYLVAQMARTPHMREYLKGRGDIDAQQVIEDYSRRGIELPRLGYDASWLAARYTELVREEAPKHQSPIASRAMRAMLWTVQALGPFGEFITSDNPVYKWGDQITSPGSRIIFPISPRLVLVGDQSKPVSSLGADNTTGHRRSMIQCKRTDELAAQSVNRAIASQAHRFLYGKCPKTLIAAIPPGA